MSTNISPLQKGLAQSIILCIGGVYLPHCSIRQSLPHQTTVHLLRPGTADTPSVFRVDNVLDQESVRSPNRVHQTEILVFELLIALRFLAFLLGLFELLSMAHFDSAVKRQ